MMDGISCAIIMGGGVKAAVIADEIVSHNIMVVMNIIDGFKLGTTLSGAAMVIGGWWCVASC